MGSGESRFYEDKVELGTVSQETVYEATPAEEKESMNNAPKPEPIVIKGLDTIINLRKEPDQEISLCYADVYHANEVIMAFRQEYIAMIPYCAICIVPLNWHYYDEVQFDCPECGRVWVITDLPKK